MVLRVRYSVHVHRYGGGGDELVCASEFLGPLHPHEGFGATWVVELHHRREGVPTLPLVPGMFACGMNVWTGGRMLQFLGSQVNDWTGRRQWYHSQC